MTGDEDYPAYLGTCIDEYDERAGRTEVLGHTEREGTITAIGAVSPPRGDISEPVNQNTNGLSKFFSDLMLSWHSDVILQQLTGLHLIQYIKTVWEIIWHGKEKTDWNSKITHTMN